MNANEREQDVDTIHAMIHWGGGFVEALGRAALKADLTNLGKIKRAFPEYWEQYSKVAVDEKARTQTKGKV